MNVRYEMVVPMMIDNCVRLDITCNLRQIRHSNAEYPALVSPLRMLRTEPVMIDTLAVLLVKHLVMISAFHD